MNAADFFGKGDTGMAGSGDGTKVPILMRRKSVLRWMAASMGLAFASATRPSAAVAVGTATYVPAWAPFTAYALGEQVIAPTNDVAKAKIAHVSSDAYDNDAVRWTTSATYALVLSAIAGEVATATVIRINDALSAARPLGTRKIVRLVGDFTTNAPLIIPSDTTLDATEATLTLASNSLCNSVQNAAVTGTRRVIDAMTTATSSTITSATAAFAAGDVGKMVTIHGAAASSGKLVTTITAVPSGTRATLAVAASTTHTAQYMAIGGRDRNVRLTGGTWIRQAGNYQSPLRGWDSNNIRFRHVDNLEVDRLRGCPARRGTSVAVLMIVRRRSRIHHDRRYRQSARRRAGRARFSVLAGACGR